MSRMIAFADRAAPRAFKLLAALHVALFLVFLTTLVLVSARAHAAPVACTGHDLLAALQTSDPAAAKSIADEAAKTPNGESLLWKVEKDGVAPSYVFGTMHMADPRVVTLPADAQKAFDASSTVVIETTEVMDQKAMMATMAAHPELMMFTDGKTLTSTLSPEDAKLVNDALDAHGIPPASVAKMKPWMIAALIALPACEAARKGDGIQVLDIKLGQDAKAQGKALEGLETVADQLGAMASLPLKDHLKSLIETVKLGDRMDDVVETMIVLYQQGRTGMVWPLFKQVLPPSDGDDNSYSAFEQTMVTARNAVMARRAAPILEKGNAFIAVGALHLPGAQGLIELLRSDGYRVTRVG